MIVMVAVTSAMVVPSITGISHRSLSDEAKMLRAVLRQASDESQLSGAPLRVILSKDGWQIESWFQGEKQGEWVASSEPSLQEYILPDKMQISDVEQAVNHWQNKENKLTKLSDKQKDVRGIVLFIPDGTTSQVNIKLARENEFQWIEVRPGPSGIKLKKKE